uniref:Exportin 5 n=1 Tax=Eptatretus burgeri TaxID=7764 RepID=A0A8C4QPI4_EPTBU
QEMVEVKAICNYKGITKCLPFCHCLCQMTLFQFCEEVKENSPCLSICGRLMATKTNSAMVRHFGLQLLEHCIKFRWINMNQEEKLQLKEDIWKIITDGTLPIMEEEAHVKDVVSRLVVEMAKREWPQQWPEMLDELKALCKIGKTQTDLVLLVLVRLVEDVICFNLLPTQRRRDIQQALNAQLGKLFEFICHILKHHATIFQHLVRFMKHNAHLHYGLIQEQCSIPSEVLRSEDYSPSCQYSRLDFEGDEEFSAFFASYRAQLGECVRLCCRLQPEVAFQIAKDSLHHLLADPIDTGCSSGQGGGLCTFSSPSFLKWDAMATFLENTMSQLFSALEKKEGLALMRQVLDYNSNDPLIHSSCLSCVSALLPFLSFNSFMLSQVLDKVSRLMSIPFVPVNRAVKNLRRHACSSLVKISRDQPELLMFFTRVKVLHVDDRVSGLEKCALMEALVLISNHFHSYDRQKSFLADILTTAQSIWLSDEWHKALWDPVQFISFVGLDRTPMPDNRDDPTGPRRGQLIYCVNVILGVLKRSRWPSNMENAQAGGFMLCETAPALPVYRNACMEQVGLMLDNLLGLISNKFFTKFILAAGLAMPVTNQLEYMRSAVERMQSFLTTLYDTCCHVLGNAGLSLGQEFYKVPRLAESMLDTAWRHLDALPDYRLRSFINILSKVFCSKSYKGLRQMAETLTLTAFCALAWKDGFTAHKSGSYICWAIIKQITPGSLPPEAITWMFTCILRSLETHGQHDGCRTVLNNLAFKAYEHLRPMYKEVNEVMKQVPQISLQSLQYYDEKILNPEDLSNFPDKRRRECFKKMLNGVIGLFHKNVHIPDLPRFIKPPKPTVSIEDVGQEDIGLTALFDPRSEGL